MQQDIKKLKKKANCLTIIGAICVGSILLEIIVLYTIVFTNPESLNGKPITMIGLPITIFLMMIAAASFDEAKRIHQLT